MKPGFFALAGFLAAAVTSTFADEQNLCPIMIDTEIDLEEIVQFEGVDVYMCCTTCTRLWETDAAYYVKVGLELGLLPQFNEDMKEKLADIELMEQRFCPLQPESVVTPNSPFVEYQGKKIYFFRERDIDRRWSRSPDTIFEQARADGLLPQFDE
ncbi:MAG: hypothetical protein AAGA96_03850 [Verrucomicrobiota bacterium]